MYHRLGVVHRSGFTEHNANYDDNVDVGVEALLHHFGDRKLDGVRRNLWAQLPLDEPRVQHDPQCRLLGRL
jgi:hypothetical protein